MKPGVLSDNGYVSTYDSLLATSSYILGRNTVWTTARTLTLPSNLTRGQDYWVGAVVDHNDTLSEVSEFNNATYVKLRVPRLVFERWPLRWEMVRFNP